MSTPDEPPVIAEERRQQHAGPEWASSLSVRAEDAWEGDAKSPGGDCSMRRCYHPKPCAWDPWAPNWNGVPA